MHDHVFFDGRIISPSEAAISTLTNASLYGKGVFTTVAVHGGQPFLWEKHWRRFQHDAAALKIDVSSHWEEIAQKALKEIIETNIVQDGRGRLTFFDGSASKIWNSYAAMGTRLLITTGEMRQISPNFRLTISPYSVNSHSPLAGIKSCNYLEKILASQEATDRGFDEAMQLNERGEITSATMANVFWLQDNALYTPGLKTGCLPGTTREFVLENLECSEVERPIDDLHSADAIFLTSAGLDVVQVTEFETRKFDKFDHAILKLIPNPK